MMQALYAQNPSMLYFETSFVLYEYFPGLMDPELLDPTSEFATLCHQQPH